MNMEATMDKTFIDMPMGRRGDMNLLEAGPGTYTIKKIDTTDADMNAFLLRLGCYEGEPITVISTKKKSCIVVIKGIRYSLDAMLAGAITV